MKCIAVPAVCIRNSRHPIKYVPHLRTTVGFDTRAFNRHLMTCLKAEALHMQIPHETKKCQPGYEISHRCVPEEFLQTGIFDNSSRKSMRPHSIFWTLLRYHGCTDEHSRSHRKSSRSLRKLLRGKKFRMNRVYISPSSDPLNQIQGRHHRS